ncbi:MAG: CHRD domain-containing protein [Comamonadaceae bacterium]|nr:MAG: CHRD domain-containing protein [Comamonadaceae bacterium]
MRANPNPPSPAAARRALPLAALAALVLAGCATSVPLPPLPPLSQPQPPMMPAPAPPEPVPETPPPPAAPVRDPQLAAFSTRLDGRNQVPPVHSMGTGTIDAVLDRESGLFRWQITYSNLSGPVTAMHIQGPADVGGAAPPLISFNPPYESPWRGELRLTPAQRAELLAGRWYLSINTARHPGGELRGQLIERR